MRGIDTETQEVYENNYFFVAPANRFIMDPELNYYVIGNRLQIYARNLANYVWVRHKDEGRSVNLDKNYFDILPGQTVYVDIDDDDANNYEVSCYQCEMIKETN